MADNVRQLSYEETQELCRQYRADFNQVAAEMQPLIDAKARFADDPNTSIGEHIVATHEGRELVKEAESRQSEIEDKIGPLTVQAHRMQNSSLGKAPGDCTTEDLPHVTAPDIFKP